MVLCVVCFFKRFVQRVSCEANGYFPLRVRALDRVRLLPRHRFVLCVPLCDAWSGFDGPGREKKKKKKKKQKQICSDVCYKGNIFAGDFFAVSAALVLLLVFLYLFVFCCLFGVYVPKVVSFRVRKKKKKKSKQRLCFLLGLCLEFLLL